MKTRLPRRTRVAIWTTYFGMWCESIVRACWPLLSVVLLYVGLIRLGNFHLWPNWGVWLVIIGLGSFLLGATVFAIKHFERPRLTHALARVDDHLAGRPLAALHDELAKDETNPSVKTLWAAHQDRMLRAAAKANAAPADFRVSAFDPFALRYAALLFALIGLVFGTAGAGRGITFLPQTRADIGPSWEAWIEPPYYTGKPSLYLADVMGQTLVVPEGSRVTVQAYGEGSEIAITESVSAARAVAQSSATGRTTFDAVRSGRLAIGGDNAAWEITVVPDMPPQVKVVSDVKSRPNGLLEQGFNATDDYGVTSGHAGIDLDLSRVQRRYGLAPPPRDREALSVPLEMSSRGGLTEFEGVFAGNFSKHPWAGLPVQLSYFVQDAAGQSGASTPVSLQLPSRSFFDPMARVLIEQRRDFLWTPANALRVGQVLRAVSLFPDQMFRKGETAETLRGIIADIEAGPSDVVDIDEIAERLWALALEIEEGDLADAKAALERAQDKLDQAIRDGADADDLNRLMDELRQAQRDYMQEFAERNPPDVAAPPSDEDAPSGQDQLAEMMEQLQDLLDQGRTEEAQRLLDEINRMMENMQTQEGQNQEGQQGAQGQQSGQNGQQGQGQQSMQGLSDTLREQQQLSDDAFRELQDQFNDQGQQEGQQGSNGQGLAERQQDLRRELERQQQAMPDLDGEQGDAARRALEDAGRAMDRAEGDLQGGDIPQALNNQSEAIDALREGLNSLGQALRDQGQASGQQQGRLGEGERRENDPLGRALSGRGTGTSEDDDMVGLDDLVERSDELADEIRRRAGDLEKPAPERDYLKRLLDQF